MGGWIGGQECAYHNQAWTRYLTTPANFLSYVLRHEPQSIGLTLDSEGWTDIATLIDGAKRAGKTIDRDLIQQVVDSSDKRRFTISEDGLRIRAAQGHSAKTVAITYPEKVPPEFLYHGTATRFLESILKEGLRPGERRYVHLSQDEQTAITVGQRYGKPVNQWHQRRLLARGFGGHRRFCFFRNRDSLQLHFSNA